MINRLCAIAALWCASCAAFAAELNGELDWANRASLSVPVDGLVTQMKVRPGDSVEAGAELVLLDARVAQAHVAQARSAVRKYQLLRAEAQREWDRAKELYDRTVLSQHELQVAEIDFANADADYRAARSAQVASEVGLELHTVKAPFAARVLAVHAAPGQAVIGSQQVQPLVTVAERGKLRVRAAAEAAQAAAFAPDTAVNVRVGEQPFEARIVAVTAQPPDAQRAAHYVVEAEFAVPADSPLRAGQPATLVLP
jgi:RND family efflux transporter MFP subunit